jgi:hypothetical protein
MLWSLSHTRRRHAAHCVGGTKGVRNALSDSERGCFHERCAGNAACNVVTTAITRAPVQTQTVYRTIVCERAQPAQATLEYRVGMRVPQTAQLYAVPETVAVEVPAIKTYKYMLVNNRVVLVDPATGEVVAELTD